MARWASDAKRFGASDPPWPSLTSALQDTTNRGLEAFTGDHRDADNACKDLRQKDRHPEIERVLRELSNTAKGKDELYEQLADRLARVASAIRDLGDDTSNSKLGYARGYMAEIERLVESVNRVKGTDRKANQIASTWPGFVRGFAPAATSLEGLKAAQFDLDRAPDKCETAAHALSDALKKFVDDRDPDGLTEGPRLATEAGEKFARAIAAMERQRSTQRGLVMTATAFDPRDDRWRPLDRQVQETADRMYAYWDRKTQEVHAACDDLAKGVRNPMVERYLDELGKVTRSDLAAFQALAKAWEKDARAIYVLDCERMDDLWDAWCSVEIEANEDPELGPVMQETARIIQDNSRRIDAVLARLGTLRKTADQLGRKAKHRDAIEAIRAELEKQERRLKRLRSRDSAWSGNRNPALQFTKTYGQQAHDRMASNYRCNVYDQSGYPGLGRGRPDCVVVEGKGKCWVYEFKPKNWKGRSPLPRYQKSVEDYYTRNMHEGRTPASNLGGSSFQALVEANCRVDPDKDKQHDTIKFEYRFQFYDRCDVRYECVQ